MQSPRSSRKAPGARRATSPHVASSSFRPVQHSQAVATTLSSRGRSPPKKIAVIVFSTIVQGHKVQLPAPAPRRRLPVDHCVCVAVADLWSARGRGAALACRCRQPAAAAAAGSRGLGWCRRIRRCAAVRRCRSRARPRPLAALPRHTIIGLGRPAVVPLQLILPGCRLRFEHLRCLDEPHSASCVCGARSRPVVWPRARRFVHMCHIGRMEH